MTQEDAQLLVAEYQRSGTLPPGFTVDHAAPHTTVQGDTYEVVQILQDNAVKISYTVKNGRLEDITVI